MFRPNLRLDDLSDAEAERAICRFAHGCTFLVTREGVVPIDAFFTSAAIFFSSAAVSFVRAKEVGHMAPSSRFAASSKPNVAYLDLNLSALLKKQTTLPSLAYAGIPYQVFGSRPGALALMRAWSRSAMA